MFPIYFALMDRFSLSTKSLLTGVLTAVLVVFGAVVLARAQAKDAAGSATLEGYVRDSAGHPAAAATICLEPQDGGTVQKARTDSEGAYRFSTLSDGRYTVRAELPGHGKGTSGPVLLNEKEVRRVDLTLSSPETMGAGLSAKAPEFFDEPSFVVAGVTQTRGAGGHGSDTILRNTEALTKATASLG